MSGKLSFTLDDRLAMCARFVRSGAKIADIGTDHACLPVWLCRVGGCPSAIAADINPLPLEKGAETVKKNNAADRVETRLSDGLEKIMPNEADDIIIAGMGGELIARIIGNWEYSRDFSKHFILQPMTKSEVLVSWLYENGFEIIGRDCCAVSGKCYTVILARYCGVKRLISPSYAYLAGLDPKNNPSHKKFTEGCIQKLLKQARGEASRAEIAKILEERCK